MYKKAKNLYERIKLIKYFKDKLYSVKFRIIFDRFKMEDMYTTKESKNLIRLPVFYGMTKKEIDYIIKIYSDKEKR